MNRHRAGQMAALIAPLAAALACPASRADAAPTQNIVLVHGAFLDGSGRRPVYDILTRDGYHVSIVLVAAEAQRTIGPRSSDRVRRCVRALPQQVVDVEGDRERELQPRQKQGC